MPNSAQSNLITKPTIRKSHADVDIIFGEKKRDCAGLGICKIEIAKPQSNLRIVTCKSVFCKLSIRNNLRYKLLVEINKKNICKNNETRFFYSQYFIVNEDYVLSDELCQYFKTPELRINKGFYPILEFDDKYLILF